MNTNSQVICIFIQNYVTPFTLLSQQKPETLVHCKKNMHAEVVKKICVHLAKLHHDVLRRDVHAEVVLGEEVMLDGRHVGHHKVDAVVLEIKQQ